MQKLEQTPLALDSVRLQERQNEFPHQLDVSMLYQALLAYRYHPLVGEQQVETAVDTYIPDLNASAAAAEDCHDVNLDLGPDGVRLAHAAITSFIEMVGQQQKVEQMEAFRRALEETVGPDLRDELRGSYGSGARP